jgi:hypothetical protein
LLFEAGLFFIGLILGLFITAMVRKPKQEWKFYLIGQLAVFLTFAAFLINGFIQENHKQETVDNETTITQLTDNSDRFYAHLALDSLQKKFAHPDDFEISKLTAYGWDTLIDSHRDTSYTIYLEYTIRGIKDRDFYSKYTVNHGGALLVSFNKDVRTAAYKHVRDQQHAIDDNMNRLEQAVK